MEEYQGIKIIYEDNHLLVVIKPANMPVCADDSYDNDLLSILKDYLKVKYHKLGNVYLGLVHRLDRPVSGIMVFAKTSKAASRLAEQIRNNTFNKVYYAVVSGIPLENEKLSYYLTKNEKTNTSYVSDKEHGKFAVLEYTKIKSKDNLSLLKIKLETGRHHQIRVSLSYRGFPIYGDHKYNKEFINNNKEDIALVAGELSFLHPVSKELLSFKIDLPNKYPFSLFC